MKITNMLALCLSVSLAVAPIAIADTDAIAQDTETQESDTTDESPAADEQAADDSDEDALDAIMAGAEVKLKYEYEVLLTDDYELPEKIAEGKSHGPIHYVKVNGRTEPDLLKEINGAQPVSSMVMEYAKEAARELKDKKKVQAQLEKAALIGFTTKEGWYVGPLQLCLREAADNLLYNKADILPNTSGGFYYSLVKDEMKTASGNYKGIFKYNTSIEWKKGLPYKAKCSVDFTPSKSKLTQKEKK